jgi:hypothetical protein
MGFIFWVYGCVGLIVFGGGLAGTALYTTYLTYFASAVVGFSITIQYPRLVGGVHSFVAVGWEVLTTGKRRGMAWGKRNNSVHVGCIQ